MVAPIIPTLYVEMDLGEPLLDTAGRPLLDTFERELLDVGWTSVVGDTRASVPISIRKGNFGNTARDRVGNVGTCKLAMDNSQYNSAGVIGYYSPDHPNCRPGFSEDTRLRVALEYGGKKRYKFQGRISEISPDTGQYRRRATDIVAEDWFGDAAEQPMVGLAVQDNKRDDELLAALMTIFENPPGATDFSTGEDVYALAFTDELGESTKVLSVLQKIAMSGLSTIFLQGGAAHGESLVYRTRVDNSDSGLTVQATLNNSMVRMKPKRSRKKLIKEVRTVVHPSEVDASPTTVLFQLQKEIAIPAGQTAGFTGFYVDPVSRRRISGKDIVTPLVADTHFKFSSSSGSGNDLNASLEVISFAPGADQGEITVKNNAVVTGYLWFMEWLGKGIYRDSPLEYRAQNPSSVRGVVLDFDMPYQDDYDLGVSIGDALGEFYFENATDVPDVEFIANRNTTLMDALLDVEPGQVVGLVEDVSYINNLYFANGHDITIYRKGTRINVLWSLVPAKLYDFFQLDSNEHGLDDANSGALGY